MKLSDLPAHARKQAEAQLGVAETPTAKKLRMEQLKTGHEHLENQFIHLLRCEGAHFPAYVRQHQFAKPRRWAFDFAWPDLAVALEVEGGMHIPDGGGRHQRKDGYEGDCEKYNEAALRGWIVLRATSTHLDDLSVMRWLERALNG